MKQNLIGLVNQIIMSRTEGDPLAFDQSNIKTDGNWSGLQQNDLAKILRALINLDL